MSLLFVTDYKNLVFIIIFIQFLTIVQWVLMTILYYYLVNSQSEITKTTFSKLICMYNLNIRCPFII